MKFSNERKLRGPQLKRIVVTSSVAAVNPFEAEGVLDESSWNEFSVNEARSKGRAAAQADKYMASKALAEKGSYISSISAILYQILINF